MVSSTRLPSRADAAARIDTNPWPSGWRTRARPAITQLGCHVFPSSKETRTDSSVGRPAPPHRSTVTGTATRRFAGAVLVRSTGGANRTASSGTGFGRWPPTWPDRNVQAEVTFVDSWNGAAEVDS